MEWSSDKIEMLINMYSSFPYLYNCKLPDYHNKTKRSASVAEIANSLGMSGTLDSLSGKSSESVQCAITGPCLHMRHRPSA